MPRQTDLTKAAEPAITALLDCAETCVLCSQACLAEKDLEPLRTCIALNDQCADVCFATARILARGVPDPSVLRSMVQACERMCRACGDECSKHGAHMEHCRICAGSCLRCADACRDLLGTLGTSASAAA
jgi:hypothetical protein